MTRRTTSSIIANWPLLVIVASIFVAGWTTRTVQTADTTAAMDAVERRLNARLDRELPEIKAELRAIREAIAPIAFHKAGP